MQRIFNYGSSLQGYALRRLLEESDPNAAVKFVDYQPGPILVPTDESNANGAKRALSKIREYRRVETSTSNKFRFFNHKRTYAKKYYPLIGIPEAHDHNLEIDLQVIGSDEVFNCVQSNVNVGYSRDLFGHTSLARHLISYAGSFGNTTLEKIDGAGIRGELEEDFSRFDDVSVRDLNSAQVVRALTGRTPAIHLDPTLVYDFAASNQTIPAERQHDGDYIIVYGYSGRMSRAENTAVRAYADSTGARVLAFGGLQASADEFIDCDPFTLLAYFRDARAIITDTFHGTIFSIINERPFATLIRKSSGHGYGNEEKLGYLLEVLGLSNRAIVDERDLMRTLDGDIDYETVRTIRQREAARTLEYLSDALSLAGAE